MSLEILVRRPWTLLDRLRALRFPPRKATLLPAVWAEELMAKRFRALMVCQPCGWKYSEGLRRWGYARHADFKVAGNRCDFCKNAYELMPVYFAEEKPQITRQQLSDEHRNAVAPWPEAYRDRSVRAWTR